MPAEIYTSRVNAPTAPEVNIRPIGLVNMPTGYGQIISAAGAALSGLDQAQAETRKAKATTEYITGLADLRDQYARDPDYQSAPQRFETDATDLQARALDQAKLNEQDAAALETTFVRLRVSEKGGVSAQSLAREASANQASLDGLQLSLSRLASQAGSPVERASYQHTFIERVDAGVRSGWITAEAGQNYIQKFAGAIDEADVLRMMREDPAGAAKALADPQNFTALDPVKRENYRYDAQNGVDQRGVDRLRITAATKPAAAALTLNRVLDPATAAEVFNKGIIPTEGGTRDGQALTSPKGAIGASQILPGTARDMATAVGLADVAKLDDAALTERLKTDTQLNLTLGRKYFATLLERYDGNAALAAAAYNAGPERADAWKAKATAAFGENFSAAQLVSVIGIAETKDYVQKVFANAGGDLAGLSLSPHGYAQAAGALAEGLATGAAEANRAIRAAADASANAGGNDLIAMMKQGLHVDDGRFAEEIAIQQQAAATGDVTAAGRLRELEIAQSVKPVIDGAWQQPVAATQAQLRAAQDEVAKNPTPDGMRKVAALSAVAASIEKLKNDDPIALTDTAAPGSTVTLDPNAAPDDPGFVRALAGRGQQALKAQMQFGALPMPFHPDEVTALTDRWTQAGESERVALLSRLGDALPPKVYDQAVAQLKLSPAMSLAGSLAATQPALTRKIVHGEALMTTAGLDGKTGTLRDGLKATIGGDIYPAGSPWTGQIVDAATAIYAANANGKASLFDKPDADGMAAAVEEITGEIVDRGGSRVPAPPGMTGSDFERLIDNLDEADLAPFGGATVPVWDIRDHATFKPRAPGDSVYAVVMPDGSPVFSAHGPLIVDFAAVAAARAGRDEPVLGQTIDRGTAIRRYAERQARRP